MIGTASLHHTQRIGVQAMSLRVYRFIFVRSQATHLAMLSMASGMAVA